MKQLRYGIRDVLSCNFVAVSYCCLTGEFSVTFFTGKLEIHNSNSAIIKEELQGLRSLLENKHNNG